MAASSCFWHGAFPFVYSLKKGLKSQDRICRLAARTCLALVAGRMVAGWGAESLFGTEGMGYYSLFFVGIVYLLASITWVPSRGRVLGVRLRILLASRPVLRRRADAHY